MPRLHDYQNAYSQVAFTRDREGVLIMRIHFEGGPARWSPTGGGLQAQLGRAFADVAADSENRAVILTGTGTEFSVRLDAPDPAEPHGLDSLRWAKLMHEGKTLLCTFLDIPVPVIAAVNGPAHIHGQLAVLSDVVLAAVNASFSDRVHFPSGFVPGDGAHAVWPMALGAARARYFLLMGNEIGAEEAMSIGFVSEVLPPERLLPRALEVAHKIAAQPEVVRRYTRMLFTRPLRARIAADLDLGLALEGLALLAG